MEGSPMITKITIPDKINLLMIRITVDKKEMPISLFNPEKGDYFT